jgi:3-hydroxyisobutyrate dehydrogenase
VARVALIGLGNMGLGMARRILEAGHQLSVFNRTASKTAVFSDGQALVCATPRDACDAADAVFAMVADDDASRAVWLGSDGILAANMAEKSLAIECSTLSHQWVVELATKARACGLRYIDAPVTGLPANAADGTLTLLVGADPADLDAARPLLSSISRRVVRFGDVGAGTAYKLIINMVGAVQIASIAEAVAIAERARLDLSAVEEAIATGQAGSPQVVRNSHRMIADDHERDIVFTPTLRLKDVEYALQFARQLGIGSPLGQLVRDQLRKLCALGYAHLNESKIVEVARTELPSPEP